MADLDSILSALMNQQQPQQPTRQGILDGLMTTWPARMGGGILQGLMAPGNAYQSTPENPVTTEQMVGPAAELAGLMVGTPGGVGGLGSGARGWSEVMTFPNAQAAREHLVELGFPEFRKGMTSGSITAPDGRTARIGMGLLSKTGQSSMGSAAQWGYTVRISDPKK